MKESKKQLLKNSLANEDYEKFMDEIKSLDVNKGNYEELLESINEIIIDKMLKTDIIGEKSSGKRLLKAFSDDDEKNFLEFVVELRGEISKIFEEKLEKYVDDEVLSKLEDFKSRFMQ